MVVVEMFSGKNCRKGQPLYRNSILSRRPRQIAARVGHILALVGVLVGGGMRGHARGRDRRDVGSRWTRGRGMAGPGRRFGGGQRGGRLRGQARRREGRFGGWLGGGVVGGGARVRGDPRRRRRQGGAVGRGARRNRGEGRPVGRHQRRNVSRVPGPFLAPKRRQRQPFLREGILLLLEPGAQVGGFFDHGFAGSGPSRRQRRPGGSRRGVPGLRGRRVGWAWRGQRQRHVRWRMSGIGRWK